MSRGQGDVSPVENLLIKSCKTLEELIVFKGAGSEPTPERFRGIRIFDISDLTMPMQVGAVQTCRGSHTHSVVSDLMPMAKLLSITLVLQVFVMKS